jgi:hypothetical protein
MSVPVQASLFDDLETIDLRGLQSVRRTELSRGAWVDVHQFARGVVRERQRDRVHAGQLHPGGPQDLAIEDQSHTGSRLARRSVPRAIRPLPSARLLSVGSRRGGTRAKPKSVVRIVISNVQRSSDDGGSSNCTAGYSPCLPPA